MTTNCFGIPDEYSGFRIWQGPDDLFYGTPIGLDHEEGDPCAPTWDELRERIALLEVAEINAEAMVQSVVGMAA